LPSTNADVNYKDECRWLDMTFDLHGLIKHVTNNKSHIICAICKSGFILIWWDINDTATDFVRISVRWVMKIGVRLLKLISESRSRWCGHSNNKLMLRHNEQTAVSDEVLLVVNSWMTRQTFVLIAVYLRALKTCS
jgi:hypothetical protein